jgi:hypothetical protein
LHLTTPALGAIDAVIRLRGNELDVSLQASRPDTRQTLEAGFETLRSYLSAVGLALTRVALDGEAAGANAGADAKETDVNASA